MQRGAPENDAGHATGGSGTDKISSLERMLSLLDLFTEASPLLTIEALSVATGYPRSTVYRYVRELADSGLLAQMETGKYSLGPRIIQFDRQLRTTDPLLNAMRRIEADLPSLADEQMWLVARLFKDQVICIGESGNLPDHLSFARGYPMPLLRGATSIAILANLPEKQLMRLFLENQTAFGASVPGQTWNDLKKSLRQIRQEGYVVSVGEVDEGVFGIGAAIFSPDGKVIGSISNVRRQVHLDRDRLEDEGRILAHLASNISSILRSINAPERITRT